MTTQQLPGRPNLDQLKRQAKDLLKAAENQEAAALARMRVLPALAKKTEAEIAAAGLALHDAQSAIAREHGFASWRELRERVEELTLEFAGALKEFVLAATDGRSGRAERLLGQHPRIAEDFYAALLLGDAARVEAVLARDPAAANRKGGARDWEPLLYVCHSSMGRSPAAQAAGFPAIAARLIALGVDPGMRFPWEHHGVRRQVLWGAVCVTQSLPLAETLLKAGATPNDGVTLTLVASGGNIAAMELLLANGADVNFPWATDGASPLRAALEWARTTTGAHWLLAQGADPNRAGGPTGETALHVAARRFDVPLVEAMVQRGADVTARRKDGRTAYVLAELSGNQAVADWLRVHGAPTQIALEDQFVAACSRGDRAAAQAMVAAMPELVARAAGEGGRVLRAAAERGDVAAVGALLDCGIEPGGADEIGATALHRAAMMGHAAVVEMLLKHRASVAALDKEFNATPLLWAAEGARMHGGADGPHAAVAKLLLAAGSSTEWKPHGEPSEAILEIMAEWRRG